MLCQQVHESTMKAKKKIDNIPSPEKCKDNEKNTEDQHKKNKDKQR